MMAYINMKLKPIFFKIACACFFLAQLPFSLHAADTIRVEPGKGTLQTAINSNGGGVVYLLEPGAQYTLEGIITINSRVLGSGNNTLHIAGEETPGMPAIIRVGRSSQGKAESALFNLNSNLILENVFLCGKDENGDFSENIINMNAGIRVELDRCVIDPAGTKRTFNGGKAANGSCLYLTNSQIFRNGSMATPNDGGWLAGMQWDTLWVENNTLVSSGQDFIGGSFHREPNNQFIWINHNSIFWHDVWIKKSFNDQNLYFTNNLLHDESLFPELPRWYPFFPDFEYGNNLLCQVAIDTLESGGIKEELPSGRRMFWEYNLMYYSPELQKVPAYAKENEIELAYLLPMRWDEDVPLSYTGGVEIGSIADSCREYRILNDRESWPHMKYANNWYDVDPLYTDTMIYSISDSAGQHILGFYRGQFWGEGDAPAVSELPSYNWDIDGYNGLAPESRPGTWPRFDGSFTNADLLVASLEGLPLGDLNWFPEEKFRWEANKYLVEAHILELNEERFQLLDPDSIRYPVEIKVINPEQIPIEGALVRMGEDSLGTTDRRGLIHLDTLSGSYDIRVSAPSYQERQASLQVSYAPASLTLVLQSPVGLDGRETDHPGFEVYPNPARDQVMLVRKEEGPAVLEVVGIHGSVLRTSFLHSASEQVDLSGISPGIYFLRLRDERGVAVENISIIR